MNKKANAFMIILGIIIFIIIVVVLGIFLGIIDLSKGINFNVGTTNICKNYDENYPDYFFTKQVACENAGGTYVCEKNKAGCYDITSWDYSSNCESLEFQMLKSMCASMDSTWTCTATEVSCEK